jgi:hypothetical protein
VDTAIRSNETVDLLEITVHNTAGSTRAFLYSKRPPFNTDWTKLFYKYLHGKSVGVNRELEAGIEAVIAKAAMTASKDFYSSEETLVALSDGLVKQIDANEKIQAIVLEEMKGFGKLAYRETKDVVAAHGKVIMADRAHDAMSAALHHAMSTSVGSVAGKMVLTALATPMVKMAITKAVITALGHAAVQHLLHLGIKKIGIAVIVGLIFGAGGASMVGWIALPIIAGVLAYQYYEMLNTFAKKMAPEVTKKIKEKAPEINKPIAEAFREAALDALFKVPKEVGSKAASQFRDWALRTSEAA